MNKQFESVWETLPVDGYKCKGHCIIHLPTKSPAIVEDWDRSRDIFTIRINNTNTVLNTSRHEMRSFFSGLLPLSLFQRTSIFYLESNNTRVERNLLSCSDEVFNRWFHIYIQGGKPNTIPSTKLSSFERRIQLSIWVFNHPELELSLIYELDKPPARTK